jgi:hypothetical protein
MLRRGKQRTDVTARLESLPLRVKPKFLPSINLFLLFLSLGLVSIYQLWTNYHTAPTDSSASTTDGMLDGSPSLNNQEIMQDVQYIQSETSRIINKLKKSVKK